MPSCNNETSSSIDLLKVVKCRALLATRFDNLEEFKRQVKLQYFKERITEDSILNKVLLTYNDNNQTLTSELTSGITQSDILNVKDANAIQKLQFVTNTPYAIRNRINLAKIYMLARKRPLLYGAGDVAFYDLAEASLSKIRTPKEAFKTGRDRYEKGYINTFNHITAQVIITAIFSEQLADFMGDVHERFYMPELTTGKFTQKQLKDTINFPTDNYVDLINNDIGQEIGKVLKSKYKIYGNTHWSPILLASFLNEIQDFYAWSFEIGLKPFTADEELIIRYAKKINTVMAGKYQMR